MHRNEHRATQMWFKIKLFKAGQYTVDIETFSRNVIIFSKLVNF